MTFTAFASQGYGGLTAARSLEALRRTGTTHVVVVPTVYMNGPNSSGVERDPRLTPTDRSLLEAMSHARSLGLRVVLKPHVDVQDGTFRGNIAPSSVAGWFRSYRTILDRYAEIASKGDADMLVVGTELSSLSRFTSEWRRTIAGARARFGGRLTFAANWTVGARHVRFWDRLDYIGIDAYMPLTPGEPNPPVAELARAWRREARQIDALRREYDKPVLFTELGYQSRADAAADPTGASAQVSQVAQARAYEAALRFWSRVPWFKGVYWWEWSAEGLNTRVRDSSFRPAGKLAENVIRRWYGAPAREDPRGLG